LLAAAATRPRLARELAVTRVARYAHGLWRVVGRPAWRSLVHRLGGARRPAPPLRAQRAANEARTGEVSHLLVAPSQQNRGTGRALLEDALDRARLAGLDEVVLVTLPDDSARRFYERLGWWADGAVSSRSGEAFVRDRYPLRGRPR
jgi:GNAT superfamily N-acetyltransferase